MVREKKYTTTNTYTVTRSIDNLHRFAIMKLSILLAVCLAYTVTGNPLDQAKKCLQEHNACIKKLESQGVDFFQARSRCGVWFIKCGMEPACIEKCNKAALGCLQKDVKSTICLEDGGKCFMKCKAYTK